MASLGTTARRAGSRDEGGLHRCHEATLLVGKGSLPDDNGRGASATCPGVHILEAGHGLQDVPCLDRGEALNGLLDEATIYDRALTAEEIQAIFNADIAGKCGA